MILKILLTAMICFMITVGLGSLFHRPGSSDTYLVILGGLLLIEASVVIVGLLFLIWA